MNDLQPKFTKTIIKGRQTAGNIASQLKLAVNESLAGAETIKHNFKGRNKYNTCFNVWDYCRKNIKYKRESENLQTAKTLQRILYDKYGDCKHYTTFCCTMLKALNIPSQMRLISQNFYNSDPTHIYCVAFVNGEEIILDPCIKTFNSEAQYKYKFNLNL